ncbi:PREDICTED: steroidogenic acute regulatory protein, mitochondrial-like isoform X2 [Crocodylus porosus]|uniref:steroidogenic acute regulatory protein, mitochondrial-like isoform X2 n=1 Tax=Crocodylus porosus TaxID=8502 RepID=UPI00093CA264|nr:PREDICTED: steroidogenic acute regulatory protein, mitochondrial-like isoform X2 [Crocodylus porosus]
MLPATFKLCCGISHEHLRRITGLKKTAMAAIGHDLQGIMLKGSHCLPSKLPGYVQRLMWKDTAGTQEFGTGISSDWFSSTELSYVNQGEVTLHRAMEILQQQNGWQMETKQGNGDAVLSTVIPQLGKVFRMDGVLAVPMDQLYHELFESLERMPEWNPTLSQVKILQRIGKDTLLTHEIASQSPGNLVGQRDFVNIRRCWKQETAVYLVGTAAYSELIPLQEERVRAEATLSCIVLQPLEENPMQTRFTWLLSMDLKGWIPKSVINYVLPQSQADFIKHLRQHLSISAWP